MIQAQSGQGQAEVESPNATPPPESALGAARSTPQPEVLFATYAPAKSILVVLQESSFDELVSEELVGIYRDMSTLTAILNLKPDLSEIDMLIYDRKRASAKHRLASMHISCFSATEAESGAQSDTKMYMREPCRITVVLYSNTTLWVFQPPIQFYGDLAIMLQ